MSLKYIASFTILQLFQIFNMGDDVSGEGEKKKDFTQTMRMRSATRKVHDTSDALVNAKLGVTMSDDSVWAEGRCRAQFDIHRFIYQACWCFMKYSSFWRRLLKGTATP